MKMATKICLIVAASLIVVGGLAFVVAMSLVKWDFSRLETTEYCTKEYGVEEEYAGISIQTDTADIRLVPSADGSTRVVCVEKTRATHRVEVREGILYVELKDERQWYDFISIGLDKAAITVYLPAGDYGALTVRSSTGDVQIPEDFAFETMGVAVSTADVTVAASTTGAMNLWATTGDLHLKDLSADSLCLRVSTGDIDATGVTVAGDAEVVVTTGDVKLTNLSCGSLTSTGGTGDLILKNVVAAGNMRIQRSTGDLRLDGCDAAELFLKVTTGDVSGTLLTDKVFVVSSSTGDVDVPASATGGRCEITTTTGDIRITIGK